MQTHITLIIVQFVITSVLQYSIVFATQTLPEEIVWQTNNIEQRFGSANAKKGGKLHMAILSFPMTFRTVGPDSNGSFRGQILGNQLSLVGIHPNTEKIIPELATHWAFGKDKKTIYFKLDKNAKWSDGKPVTANDYTFTLEFMRSKHITAPWYNDYYSKEIDKVIVFDDYTIAVVGTKAEPDLHLKLPISPMPRHFYGKLGKDFTRKYNWKIVPNTGPYQIFKFKKGKYITFKRKKNWWAKNNYYFKNRFNVDKVTYTVVRDFNIMWEYFKKGKIDIFSVTMPNYWHIKCKTPVIENGYVDRIWFFNDTPQSARGMWLNTDKEIFKDINVRYAFAHAMNIQKVIDHVLRGDYYRLEQSFEGYGRYTDNTIVARRFNLELVDKYMKKAGWKRGPDGIWAKKQKRFSVELTYGLDAHTSRVVVLKEEAKKAGIELRLQKLDSAASFKKFLEKKHDIAWMGWSTNLRPSYWQCVHSDNAHKTQTNNITNTDNPEIDILVDQYRNSLDEDTRIKLSKRIQQKIHQEGAFIPTFKIPYFRQAYWRWWSLPKIRGTKFSDSLFDPFGSTTGGFFWFDKKKYEETKKAMKSGEKFPETVIIDKMYYKLSHN